MKVDSKVEVRTLPEVHVAYMRYIGPYGDPRIPELWDRFNAWCKSSGLVPPPRRMYGISPDNPDTTPPEQCRYDVCIEVPKDFQPTGDVSVQDIPGGKYACKPFEGRPDEIHSAWMEFCGSWIPANGYHFDSRPAFEFYDVDFAYNEETGEFACDLCVGIK